MKDKEKDAESPRIAVRPKSSHRKQWSIDARRSRLNPVQERSRRRHDAILDAAARLLETENIENLSHSEIAAAAGISKPGVHYHFPTIVTVQLALGRRYDAELSTFFEQHKYKSDPNGWQDLIRDRIAVGRDWFNERRPACEALLGPMLTREVRLAQLHYNAQSGDGMLSSLRRYFQIPEGQNLRKVITFMGEIIDLFWSRSYLRKGYIDDDALTESIMAAVGYLRNFLPEYVPKRMEQGVLGPLAAQSAAGHPVWPEGAR